MKRYLSRLITLFLIVALFLFSDCRINISSSQASEIKNPSIFKIEVIHFHGTYDCNTCRTAGKYAEETLKTFYAKELKEGKIVFRSINAYLPENKDIVFDYGVMSSSLWLGVYHDSGFHKEQLVKAFYKVNNRTDFMNYLKRLIDKRLEGDLTQ